MNIFQLEVEHVPSNASFRLPPILSVLLEHHQDVQYSTNPLAIFRISIMLSNMIFEILFSMFYAAKFALNPCKILFVVFFR